MSFEMTDGERAHFDTLAKWRNAMDLVGPGPLEPHFEDSFHAVDGLKATGRWADLGSGAGFPGVALACRNPEAEVLMVESRQKRVMFLREVVSRGRIGNAEVFHGRSEKLENGTFDGVISRAYRPPADFLEQARELLVPGGRVVLMMARGDEPQVDGLEVFHVEHYELEGRPRKAVTYKKPL